MEKMVYIHKKILPVALLSFFADGVVGIIGRDDRKSLWKITAVPVSKYQAPLSVIAVPNFQMVMKMQFIDIVSIITNPGLSQKRQDIAAGGYIIITELCPFLFLSRHVAILPIK
jgi:hypothetical protein